MSNNALRSRCPHRAPVSAPEVADVAEVTVKSMQRTRLLSATLRQCAAMGSAELTVAGIVSAAGISRRTFYELFPDVKRCMLAMIEERLEVATGLAREAYRQPEGWSEQVRAGLGAVLTHFEREPDVARVLIVETLRAGPEAAALRRRTVTRLAAVLEQATAGAGPGAAVCSLTGQATVAAVLGVLHDRVSAQARPKLSTLLNELMCVIVAPYMGSAAARRQLRRAPRPPARGGSRRKDPLAQLPMRLTYRTMRVLLAIGQRPGESNRQIAVIAGIEDQGQASKLLSRLRLLGLAENRADGPKYGVNAWSLTEAGLRVEREIAVRTRAGSV